MQKFIISESDRSHILNLYKIVKEEPRPLQKLLECKYTPDGKYIMYENKIYSCQTGEEVPIMEGWSISDILHTGADLLSMGLDFVIPGSGAVVDALNALSYIIEAQFRPAEERDSLYTMAAITFAFVILPGPLQAVAPVLKRAIKTGKGFASNAVVGGLEIIGKNLGTILGGIKNLLQKALQSKLAKGILGKHGDNLSNYIQKFYDRVKTIFDGVLAKAKGTKTLDVSADTFKKLTQDSTESILKGLNKFKFDPKNTQLLSKSNVNGREAALVLLPNNTKVVMYKSKKLGTFVPADFGLNGLPYVNNDLYGKNNYINDLSSFLNKNGAEGLSKTKPTSLLKTTAKELGQLTISKQIKANMDNFFKKLPKISKGSMVLRKLGFVPGKTYRLVDPKGVSKTITIKGVSDNGIQFFYGKSKIPQTLSPEQFVGRAIGAPWGRKGYSVTVPFFIKRFGDMLTSNGDINYEIINGIPDANPDQVSKESLEYLQVEVGTYEGEGDTYSFQTNVKTFQDGLELLGYKLVRFGADGKFGTETQEQLKKFQTDNGLTTSLGKMDRLTAKKLSELLKTKNIPNSQEIQNQLNKI
jgi:hypothetical protein